MEAINSSRRRQLTVADGSVRVLCGAEGLVALEVGHEHVINGDRFIPGDRVMEGREMVKGG